ncbi:MAG: elongation factor G-like protein EF-G2 [Geodermatophilaceae bacterium]|nr:elongation factor G-like protein EF-G2 [Geodermatophilaceae bacterium]
MSKQASPGRGTDGSVRPANDPSRIRNIALVGRSGSGKTTLVESLLMATGAINRMGSIAEGNTVSDSDPAEIKQQRSVSLALAPLRHELYTINLLDTPGYADFVGELRAGLRGADAALFVVAASDDVDAATMALWEECAAVGLPRAVVIARLDHPRADWDKSLAACKNAFGDGVAPLYLPLHADDGPVCGLIGLLSQQVFDHSAGGHVPAVRDPEPEHRDGIIVARGNLIESIIAESEDETLMERYLEGEDIDVKTLIDDLETAVSRGSFFPVLGVCATSGLGISALLELLVGGFPHPGEHALPTVTEIDGSAVEPLTADPGGPLVGEIIKTTIDAYVGRVSLIRIFSGTIRAESALHVSGHGLTDRGHDDHDADERIGSILSPLGTTLRPVAECIAGDLCAVTKLVSAETGDTVSARERPLLVEAWAMPEPLLPIAVAAKTRADEDALAKGLSRLIAGDPTLRLERNAETHQLVLWCMGESHADVVLDRLRSQGVDLETVPVAVALRETLVTSAEGLGRHVKQSGGHGQYAVAKVTVEPLERGAGFEFVDKVVGGAVPHNYIPSVEKGVRAQMERGLDAGFPLVDVRVTLVDGKAHSVDSSDAAFQTAGSLALREAGVQAGVSLLEPVHDVLITVPDEHVGTVMSDLSSRRGHVTGTEATGGERTVVRAEIPETSLIRYAIDLRSFTGGTGRFTRTFLRYDPMPEHEASAVRAERAAAR